MADAELNDEDLFADLYEDDEAPPAVSAPAPVASTKAAEETQSTTDAITTSQDPSGFSHSASNNEAENGHQSFEADKEESPDPVPIVNEHGFTGTVGIKEDGKMFIGGLNWETDETSMQNYFSQFGEVTECTVMRDSNTGRSRGFGFLTFKDPKTVNVVMVKEHFLDGKIIDPKRAIPRDEQERTSKIFVGGVSQDATEADFQSYFEQFGRVVDATLMMDKETGRPRGFGFVTFEGDDPVDACLAQPLEILGKPIEVKRAQPRGNLQEEERNGGKFGQRGANNRFGRNDQGGDANAAQQQAQGAQNGMSPFAMAQAWMRMQQMMSMMQHQMAAQQMQGGMNPMMQQQMMMQQMQQQQQRAQDGGNSPASQGMNGMTPQMMQQMQQQMAAQQQQQGNNRGMSPMNAGGRQGFNTPDPQGGRGMGGQQGFNGGPSSWEGMYDDVPQPNAGVPSGPGGGGGGFQQGGFRGGRRGNFHSGPGGGQAPANAPTGPKNPGRGGGGYRGGGRGGNRGFHPYNRH